jgi:hypothetical protein
MSILFSTFASHFKRKNMDILDLARRNQQKAWKIIEDKNHPGLGKCGCQSKSRRFLEYGVTDETPGY